MRDARGTTDAEDKVRLLGGVLMFGIRRKKNINSLLFWELFKLRDRMKETMTLDATFPNTDVRRSTPFYQKLYGNTIVEHRKFDIFHSMMETACKNDKVH